VREKELPARALVALCRGLLPLCRRHRTPLLVNDRCDVALSAELDGVHLAQSSIGAADARALLGPDALIGVSCHDLPEVDRVLDVASYLEFGPIYAPTSKRSPLPPLGLPALRLAAAQHMPLYAIGGISPKNAAEVRASGARGLAVIGWGLGADEPASAVALLWRAWCSEEHR
jgi:thiamine-phosphate pyrophosphorylase